MENQSAECSAAILSCSAPAAAFMPKRVRWAAEPTHHHSHNEASPAATSTPIDIPYPNRTYNMPKGSRMAPRKPTAIEFRCGDEDRIHHKLDNVTDYCKRGYNGWEFALDKRIEKSNEGTGNIIAGEWPDRKTWYIPVVVRKDVNFGELQESTGEWDDGHEIKGNGRQKAYAKDELSENYRRHVAGRKLKMKAEAFERRNAARRLEFA